LAFKSFDFERTLWMLFQKRFVRTKFDIYVLAKNAVRLESLNRIAKIG
jgi:hypothetical protein